jgi:hypothetical protein
LTSNKGFSSGALLANGVQLPGIRHYASPKEAKTLWTTLLKNGWKKASLHSSFNKKRN